MSLIWEELRKKNPSKNKKLFFKKKNWLPTYYFYEGFEPNQIEQSLEYDTWQTLNTVPL